MTDRQLYTRLSFVMTGTVTVLTGLALYVKALPLILPGVAALAGIWASSLYLRERSMTWARVLTLVYLGYATWFACLTGGFYSPGLLLLFFTPVIAGFNSDRKLFLVSNGLVAAVLAFFYLGPAWGPGAMNLNTHRLFFLGVVFLTFGAGLGLGMTKRQEDRRRMEASMKASEDNLNKVSEDAKNALEVKDRFLANMSHEIRNPMNGIIGMMHVLLDSDLDEEQRKHSNIVYSSARALLSIVNDILDLSKIEAGKMELDIRPFDLDIAIEDIVSLPELQARQKGIDFNYTIHADVPKLLKGDIGRIRQVILNLTGNAIKFTESGSVGLEIKLKEDGPEKARLHFCIEDTGIGISDEVLAGLFSAFVQADASITKEYGGTGLGLSIAKLMVEKMGGRIGAESIEMIGSTFWFELPLDKQAPGETVIDLAAVPLRKSKVLVLSDAEAPSRHLSASLTGSSINYDTARGQTEACEMLKSARDEGKPFHVLITEVQESDQFARAIGKRIQTNDEFSKIKLILVTAVGQKGDAREFEEMGFSAYLSLPLEEGILPDCIRAVFASSSDDETNGHPLITRFTLAESKKQCCRILVVEDMETNLITAKALINKQGYNTDEARNGALAVEKVKTDQYDLILMDCQMPVMDGYEATRQIRAHETEQGLEKTPIIAMTGNAFEKDREKCFRAGMDDFIPKPVEPDILNRKLHNHLSREGNNRICGAIEPEVSIDPVRSRELPPVFDREKCNERFGNDDELIQVVLDSFMQETPDLINNLTTAVRDQDADNIRSCAHALKGSAANVNAEQLKETAFSLEKMADQGNLESAGQMLATIENQLNAFTGEARI
ncbi:MAG: response regulator [Desulfobacterales bacterium]|nr:response regulator [Desulfobacterales bacterium]